MITITDVTINCTTTYRNFEIDADIKGWGSWDSEDMHVYHVDIRAHNAGTEFARSFDDHDDYAAPFTVCNADVDFEFRDIKSAEDIEELVRGFVRAFLLGTAPFALRYGWFSALD